MCITKKLLSVFLSVQNCDYLSRKQHFKMKQKEPLISRFSGLTQMHFIIFLFSTFHYTNCFISSSTTTIPPLVSHSSALFYKINHSDAVVPTSVNRNVAKAGSTPTAVWNTFFVKPEGRSGYSPQLSPAPSSVPSSSSSIALYNNSPIRAPALNQQQAYKVLYMKPNDNKVESKSSKPVRQHVTNQQINENDYYKNVYLLLNKI